MTLIAYQLSSAVEINGPTIHQRRFVFATNRQRGFILRRGRVGLQQPREFRKSRCLGPELSVDGAEDGVAAPALAVDFTLLKIENVTT